MKNIIYFVVLSFIGLTSCSKNTNKSTNELPPPITNKTPDEISEEEREAEQQELIQNQNNEQNNDKRMQKLIRQSNSIPVNVKRRKTNTAILFKLDQTASQIIKNKLSFCSKQQFLIKVIADKKGNVYLKPGQSFPVKVFSCLQKHIRTIKVSPGNFRKGVIKIP